MRHRALPLALLIAASLTPISGCSDNDDAPNQSQDGNLAAEQTADTSASESDSGSPIPVNNPNDDSEGDQPSSASKSQPTELNRIEQLAQQIQAIKDADPKRLDDQAQRIDQLETQVESLTQRLRRLPQPRAEQNADSGDQHPTSSKTPPPAAVSPPSDAMAQPRESKPSAQSDAESSPDDGSADESGDDDASDAASASGDSPPASAQVTGANIVAHCVGGGDRSDQFDVFFQAATGEALDAATDQVKSAGLSDWFALMSASRLYVGRYGTCPLASRRRDDVHQRTGLALNIQAVRPQHKSAAKQAHNQSATDYGASDTASATIRTSRPAGVRAPFEIVGVEIRGTHHYLGVAPQGATGLSAVSWLSPGDAYGSWTLRAIRTDVGTATFRHDGATVAVALPRRG